MSLSTATEDSGDNLSLTYGQTQQVITDAAQGETPPAVWQPQQPVGKAYLAWEPIQEAILVQASKINSRNEERASFAALAQALLAEFPELGGRTPSALITRFSILSCNTSNPKGGDAALLARSLPGSQERIGRAVAAAIRGQPVSNNGGASRRIYFGGVTLYLAAHH